MLLVVSMLTEHPVCSHFDVVLKIACGIHIVSMGGARNFILGWPNTNLIVLRAPNN